MSHTTAPDLALEHEDEAVARARKKNRLAQRKHRESEFGNILENHGTSSNLLHLEARSVGNSSSDQSLEFVNNTNKWPSTESTVEALQGSYNFSGESMQNPRHAGVGAATASDLTSFRTTNQG